MRSYLGASVGTAVGILTGLFGVTVSKWSDGGRWPNEHLLVRLFGMPIHEEIVLTESRDGPLWGMGITALLALVGAILCSGVAELTRPGRGK
jgi:hypothetical protein